MVFSDVGLVLGFVIFEGHFVLLSFPVNPQFSR